MNDIIKIMWAFVTVLNFCIFALTVFGIIIGGQNFALKVEVALTIMVIMFGLTFFAYGLEKVWD